MTSQQLSINELMESDWHSLLKVLGADSEVDTDAREKVVDLADFVNTL
ncbi:hypothetical protein ACWN8M_09045 [Pseudolactococcus reticulitermitis]|uniref:Uncharacterized protein n=1 Tax=Pseudolactococcus reticulitermitis TaxID=2025039 RepID=A0A224X3L6_9LACT|nr:hypothetical protein RsY01_915 [Lactococcus reticulitermitis]